MDIAIIGAGLTAGSPPAVTDVQQAEPAQWAWNLEPWSAPGFSFDAGDPGGE